MGMKVDSTTWGKGAWLDNNYLLHTCPICHENWTFRFLGGDGFWICHNCKKSGDWHKLRDILGRRDDWLDLIPFDAEIEEVEGLISVGSYTHDATPFRIPTGFSILDNMFEGFTDGGLTILTGKRGEGKSTFASQLALNAVSSGVNVCFYSGELGPPMFQSWVFTQAAGPLYLEQYKEKSGAPRYRASKQSESLIREWLDKRFFLSDNAPAGSSEHKVVLGRFKEARQKHSCRLLVVDNLMTMSYTNEDNDFNRKQTAFVSELVAFAQQNTCHVILVAHPRKGNGEKVDDNEMVAGSGNITNMASLVIKVSKVAEEDVKMGVNAHVTVTKNREFGATGEMDFEYDLKSRRFKPVKGSMITRMPWEEKMQGEG
jgi:twinkle protein